MEAESEQQTSLKYAERKENPALAKCSRFAIVHVQQEKPWRVATPSEVEDRVNQAKVIRDQEYKEEKTVCALNSNEGSHTDRTKSSAKLISDQIFYHFSLLSHADNSDIFSDVSKATYLNKHSAKLNKTTSLKYKSDSSIEHIKTSTFSCDIVEKEGLNPRSLTFYPWSSKLFTYINEVPSQSSFVDVFDGGRNPHCKKSPLRDQEGESCPVNSPVSKSLELIEATLILDKTPSYESSMTINLPLSTETDTEPCTPEHMTVNLIIQRGSGMTLQRASTLPSNRSSEKAFQPEIVSKDSIISTNNSNRGIFHRLFGRVPRAAPNYAGKVGKADSQLKLQQYLRAPKSKTERSSQRIADPKLRMLKNLADSIIAVEIQAARIKRRRLVTQSIGNQTEFASDQRRYFRNHLDSEEKPVNVSKAQKKKARIKEDLKNVTKVRIRSPSSDSSQTASAISQELPKTKKSFSMNSHQFESISLSTDEGLDQKPVGQRNAGTSCCIVQNRRAVDLFEHSRQNASLVCSTLESRSPTLKFPNRIKILNAIQDLGPKASNLTPKALVYELVSVRSDEMGDKSEEQNLLLSPRTSLSAVSTSNESLGCLDSLSKAEKQAKSAHALLSMENSDASPDETNDIEKAVLNLDFYLDETSSDSKQNESLLKPEGNVLSHSINGCTTSSESISMAQSVQRKSWLSIPRKESGDETLKSATSKTVAKSRSLRAIEANREKRSKMTNALGSDAKKLFDNKVQVLTQKTRNTAKDNEESKSKETRKQNYISEPQNDTIAPMDTLSSTSSSSSQALDVEIKANKAWLCQEMCIRTHEASEECGNFDESLRTDVNIKFSPASLISCDHIRSKPVVTIKID